MTALPAGDSTVDDLDEKILHALNVSPRLPFSVLAAVLDVSEQTVARRYRRMHRAGLLRITAVLNVEPLGQSNWMVRAQCRPSGANSLAQALARRDDVGWVSLTGGGAEVVCVLRSRSQEARDDLLIERLPRTSQVLSLSAAVVLHRFAGGNDEWRVMTGRLSAEQSHAITSWHEQALDLRGRRSVTGEPTSAALDASVRLSDGDMAMLDALVADGRASYATLAAAGGTTPGRATRRLAALLGAGLAHLDVDFAMAPLGFACSAVLWLTVAPGHLDAAGVRLGEFVEVAFVGAISGAHNLVLSVVCRDLAALYTLITDKIGTVDGVQSMEISPVLRVVKQAGAMMADGGRLAV